MTVQTSTRPVENPGYRGRVGGGLPPRTMRSVVVLLLLLGLFAGLAFLFLVPMAGTTVAVGTTFAVPTGAADPASGAPTGELLRVRVEMPERSPYTFAESGSVTDALIEHTGLGMHTCSFQPDGFEVDLALAEHVSFEDALPAVSLFEVERLELIGGLEGHVVTAGHLAADESTELHLRTLAWEHGPVWR